MNKLRIFPKSLKYRGPILLEYVVMLMTLILVINA